MMSADSAKQSSMEQMKQTAQRFLDLWFSGKTEGIEEIVAENFKSNIPMPGVSSTGIQQLKDMIAISSAAFTDNKTEDMHMIADGDRVVVHYRWKGVNTGPMGEGMPATNKSIDVHTVDVLRFENGKVAEHWGYMEEFKMMEQLGMMGGGRRRRGSRGCARRLRLATHLFARCMAFTILQQAVAKLCAISFNS
jgi:steroid delta-isomerase-like uncharacterized protein